MKKTTLATLKAWLRRNHENLAVRVDSSFNGMIDCTEWHRNAQWRKHPGGVDMDDRHTLGIQGLWLVGNSRDSIEEFASDGFAGFTVSNACGSVVVAKPPENWTITTNTKQYDHR